ncbi:MAG: hypothetical protein ACJA2Q_001724 [Pseudohongiellaceae bacterium]
MTKKNTKAFGGANIGTPQQQNVGKALPDVL